MTSALPGNVSSALAEGWNEIGLVANAGQTSTMALLSTAPCKHGSTPVFPLVQEPRHLLFHAADWWRALSIGADGAFWSSCQARSLWID